MTHSPNRTKAYWLMFLGLVGLFVPFIPGVVLIVLGLALLADKKGKLNVHFEKLTQKAKKFVTPKVTDEAKEEK